ncbi:MAG: response regulator transcription factor [Pseudonocardia sp.]
MRVVVVDDHAVFRAGLAAIMASLPGVEVVGEAGDGLAAIDVVAASGPDLVVMDLHMPRLDGVEATRRLTATHPHVAVLVLTMLSDDASVHAALAAGARGYLLKESGRADLARALDAVAAGQAILDGGIAGRVLAGVHPAAPAPDPAAFPYLTAREREVLDLLARGLTNAAIAARLFLSEKTVRNHVSNVFAKLHVTERAAAVALARDAGYGQR